MARVARYLVQAGDSAVCAWTRSCKHMTRGGYDVLNRKWLRVSAGWQANEHVVFCGDVGKRSDIHLGTSAVGGYAIYLNWLSGLLQVMASACMYVRGVVLGDVAEVRKRQKRRDIRIVHKIP
jgi:hypothetical protein